MRQLKLARAGEHGRGFAVVAEEVRRLADSSKQAAVEITRISKESLKYISGKKWVKLS